MRGALAGPRALCRKGLVSRSSSRDLLSSDKRRVCAQLVDTAPNKTDKHPHPLELMRYRAAEGGPVHEHGCWGMSRVSRRGVGLTSHTPLGPPPDP